MQTVMLKNNFFNLLVAFGLNNLQGWQTSYISSFSYIKIGFYESPLFDA